MWHSEQVELSYKYANALDDYFLEQGKKITHEQYEFIRQLFKETIKTISEYVKDEN